jgi:hypothetical protein
MAITASSISSVSCLGLPPRRWVVQFFSFLDGTPNKLGVYPESYLIGDDCALYQSEEIWRHEYEKAERRYRWEEEAGR